MQEIIFGTKKIGMLKGSSPINMNPIAIVVLLIDVCSFLLPQDNIEIQVNTAEQTICWAYLYSWCSDRYKCQFMK